MLTWKEFLSLPRSRFFWVSRNAGRYDCGHTESYYFTNTNPEGVSFDTGNNSAITVSGMDGEIKSVTLFNGNSYQDGSPGVWVKKDVILAGAYHYEIKIGDTQIALPHYNGKIRTDLVECVLPLTTYELEGLTCWTVTFAPLSQDGSRRPRGAFYLLTLQNTSDAPKAGEVILPKNKWYGEGALANNNQIDIFLLPECTRHKTVPFDLAPGQTMQLPVWLGAYGVKADFDSHPDAMYWLEQTLGYYRRLMGCLSMPDRPFVAEWMIRTLCQCQQSLGMDQKGMPVGISLGTTPTLDSVFMKDMYYTMLPLAQTDPNLFRSAMEWFFTYGIRPAGTRYPGGVFHSISNSLSATVMAGMYYRATNDRDYFVQHPEIVSKMDAIMDEIIASRRDDDPWLFGSVWLSDGLCLGDFHTGSNIVVWAALTGYELILRHALGRAERADRFAVIAQKVKNELLTRCVTDGPYGPQFREGINRDRTQVQAALQIATRDEFINQIAGGGGWGVQLFDLSKRDPESLFRIHDGEESDTTLCSFYGLLPFDAPIMKNFTRYALTEHNPLYRAVSQGIGWEEDADATFPSYATGLSNAIDYESFDEYFERIYHLVDLDGSIWWWPYPRGAKDHSAIRRALAKCGWASGVLLSLLSADLIGARYDAPNSTLSVKPLNALGRFEWKDMPLGNARFDLSYDAGRVDIRNLNGFDVTAEVQLSGSRLFADGVMLDSQLVSYLGKDAAKAKVLIPAGNSVTIQAE